MRQLYQLELIITAEEIFLTVLKYVTCKNGLTAGKQRLSLAALAQWLSLSTDCEFLTGTVLLSPKLRETNTAKCHHFKLPFYLYTTHYSNIRWNWFSIQRSPIFERALLFGMFPDFARCPSGESSVYVKISMEHLWNDTDRGNRSTDRRSCHSATLSTTYFIGTGLGSNPRLQGERPAPNHLSHGT